MMTSHTLTFPLLTLCAAYASQSTGPDAVDGKLMNLHAVETPEHLEKTLIISFEQNRGNGGEGMMLGIHQPFGQALQHRAQIMDFDVPGSFKLASTCPVVPNGDSYET